MTTKYRFFAAGLRAATEADSRAIDEFAEMMGYKSPFLVQRWYDGEALPRLDQLKKIAGVLGTHLEFLLADWIVDQEPELAWCMKSFLASQQLAIPDYT